MSKDITHENPTINPKGLILLWAFAESGIGGMLHALKLPFTGIFVGGIAVITISLLSYYTRQKKIILQALGIVLLIKLTVSPHSPWQAYVAVIFQGILGYLIFNTNENYKLKNIVFCIVCLLESAIQKILITLLIYGLQLMEAIDKAAVTLFQSIGFQSDTSMVGIVFIIYILLHLLVGIILGIWIPTIPEKIHMMNIKIQSISQMPITKSRKTGWKTLLSGSLVLVPVLLVIKWLVPEIKLLDLIIIFLRSTIISLGLIFIIGPIIKMLLIRITKNQLAADRQMLKEIMDDIPKFTSKAFSILHWARNEYSGIARIKNFILGLLWLSLQDKYE